MFVAEGTNIGRVESQCTGPGCRKNGTLFGKAEGVDWAMCGKAKGVLW